MNADQLRSLVFADLDCAVDENGYRELLTLPAAALANDLTTCDADLEEYADDPSVLIPYVEAWQKKRDGR